jgi:hypothetical protein
LEEVLIPANRLNCLPALFMIRFCAIDMRRFFRNFLSARSINPFSVCILNEAWKKYPYILGLLCINFPGPAAFIGSASC